MTELLKLIFGVLASLFKSRAKLEAEILILRQQINVLRRRMPKRPDLNKAMLRLVASPALPMAAERAEIAHADYELRSVARSKL